jgi:hypothetical protein
VRSGTVTEVVHVPPHYPTSLIWVDESSVKASSGRFFVVGAVKARQMGKLMRDVREIRDRYGYGDEFKFSRITRGRLSIFCELVDLLERSDAHIAATVVDRSIGRDPFKPGEAEWIAHAKVTAQLLVGIINRRELASALLDHVSVPKGCSFEDVVRGTVNRRMRATSLVSAVCADSKCNDGLQLADLVVGAVAHQRGQGNGTASATSHKGKIASRLAAAFDVPNFEDVRTDRVNIATLTGSSARQSVRSPKDGASFRVG